MRTCTHIKTQYKTLKNDNFKYLANHVKMGISRILTQKIQKK